MDLVVAPALDERSHARADARDGGVVGGVDACRASERGHEGERVELRVQLLDLGTQRRARGRPACDGGVCPSCDRGAAGAARRRWALVPVADLFNHAHGGPVAVGYDGEADAYTYHAAAPIAQGAEVMLQYGARDNASLLLQYGFTLRDNPHGSLPFALSDRGDAGPRPSTRSTTSRATSGCGRTV